VGSVDDIRRLVALDHGLATISTLRSDGSIHGAVVNAGVVDHPVDGQPVAAFVAAPATHKLANLRARPRATLLWRAGWAWVAVEGVVDLVGPDDALDGVDPATVPALLRTIYSAAGGGEHSDWADYDRVMAAERRVAVLLRPGRITLNP
jgi:PPOX class probable F420-dependent enzyme